MLLKNEVLYTWKNKGITFYRLEIQRHLALTDSAIKYRQNSEITYCKARHWLSFKVQWSTKVMTPASIRNTCKQGS